MNGNNSLSFLTHFDRIKLIRKLPKIFKTGQIAVLKNISERYGKNNSAWPSIRLIASDEHMSIRSVHYHLKFLISIGILIRIPHLFSSSIYIVNDIKLQELAMNDQLPTPHADFAVTKNQTPMQILHTNSSAGFNDTTDKTVDNYDKKASDDRRRFIVCFLEKLEMNKKQVEDILYKYKLERILDSMEYMKNYKHVINSPIAFLLKTLREGYKVGNFIKKEIRYLSPEETKKEFLEKKINKSKKIPPEFKKLIDSMRPNKHKISLGIKDEIKLTIEAI